MKIRQTIIVGIAAAGGFLFAINSVWAQESLMAILLKRLRM